jgi:hypothetical protein
MSKRILTTRKIYIIPDSERRQNSHFEIEYDLLKTSYSDIERILSEQDIYLATGIKNRFLSIWYEHLDNTARDNANAPPPACYNKPPRRPG